MFQNLTPDTTICNTFIVKFYDFIHLEYVLILFEPRLKLIFSQVF